VGGGHFPGAGGDYTAQRSLAKHHADGAATLSGAVWIGDAFVAGLLWHLAGQGLPQDDAQLKGCLERAQICGGLATTAKGAMTALPYLDHLQQQLA